MVGDKSAAVPWRPPGGDKKDTKDSFFPLLSFCLGSIDLLALAKENDELCEGRSLQDTSCTLKQPLTDGGVSSLGGNRDPRRPLRERQGRHEV